MQRRVWPGWLALVFILMAWPVMGAAQQDSAEADQEEETTAVEEEADSVGVDEDPEADAEPGDEVVDEGEVQEGESEAEPGDESAAQEVDTETEDGDEVVDESADDEMETPEEAEDEVVEGPGGRELRTDYPGTDEALQADMETGEIEGIDVPEGEDPAEVYDLRVRELETQLDDLQERVFRSKSRIALLRETVLAENLAGSRAVVNFQNDLGGSYTIERMIFSVDGSQVFSEVDPNGASDDEGIEVFSGPMAPGTHTVSVTLGLRGSGYGVFSYAEGYEFDLRFSCQFTAEEGRTTMVTVQSYESGNAFTAHEDRPDGICEVSMVDLTVEDLDEDAAEELRELEGDDEMPELD